MLTLQVRIEFQECYLQLLGGSGTMITLLNGWNTGKSDTLEWSYGVVWCPLYSNVYVTLLNRVCLVFIQHKVLWDGTMECQSIRWYVHTCNNSYVYSDRKKKSNNVLYQFSLFYWMLFTIKSAWFCIPIISWTLKPLEFPTLCSHWQQMTVCVFLLVLAQSWLVRSYCSDHWSRQRCHRHCKDTAYTCWYLKGT